MAKKELELDTPFRRGEKVVATRDIRGVPSGTQGRIQLHNGLGRWDRYWVLFGDQQVGQVDHDDLTRPYQLDDWLRREEERAEAALRSESEQAQAAAEAAAGDNGGGGGGIASQIPAHLLERSKAAKQRLLG